MSVIVIDQIMGSFKTTFAIEYMKSRPLENFMYITPYLEEIKRIKLATKDKKQFISPENKGSGKLESLKYLIRNEEDIASTHELFRHYDLETREELQRTKYTLILDEVLDVLEPYPIKKDDLKILKDSKCISIDEEGYVIWNNDYKDYDSEYNEIKNLSESHMLFFLKDTVLLWKYPPEIFDLFENVFILTYLFEGSIMKYYFDYHEIQYTKKCVSKQNNKYILCDFKRSNTSKYKELITIYDEPNKYKLFQKPSALSKNWFEQNKDKCNIFKNQGSLLVLNYDNLFSSVNIISSDIFVKVAVMKLCGLLLKTSNILQNQDHILKDLYHLIVDLLMNITIENI